MRYLDKFVSAMVFTGLLIGSAATASAAGKSGKFVYLGPKIQSFIINDSATSGQAINVGAMGGFLLLGPKGKLPGNLGGGTLAVEGEASFTVVPGTWEYSYICGFATTCTVDGDWTLDTFGVFAAYRYPSGGIEWKAKAGLQRYQFETEVDIGGVTVTGSDTAIDPTVGGGLSLPMGPGTFEAELLLADRSETTFSIGVAYLFKF